MDKVFSEYGLIALLLVSVLIWLAKYITTKDKENREDRKQSHEEFSKNLENVTASFTHGLDKLVATVTEEHDKQNRILSKLDVKQDVILRKLEKVKLND